MSSNKNKTKMRVKVEIGRENRTKMKKVWNICQVLSLNALLLSVIFSCEKTIYPELDTPENIIVVDAWVSQNMERQIIKITRSQPYFDNSAPQKIPGALVEIEDLENGDIYSFLEGNEYYYWDPATAPFGEIGHNYRLVVTVDGETFEAFSRLGRVPPVDSVSFTYNEKDIIFNEDYYTAEFMASDPMGIGDAYWIKTWKNGNYLNKPSELNFAFDAGFSTGQSLDGQAFIIPIRRDLLNPYDENPENKSEFLPPYAVGDSVYVEIHSIDPQAFGFLYEIYLNTSRPGGFAELFSSPLANTTTNLASTVENSPTNIAGFFNVSAVSSGGRKLTQELADKVKQQKN